MAQFIGKWKIDGKDYKNFDAYCKAAGITGEFYDQYKKSENTMDIKRDGDTWTIVYESNIQPTQTFTFQAGKEAEYVDPEGNQQKYTIIFESDNKMIEKVKSAETDWKETVIVREAKGDNYTEEQTLPCGTKMTGVAKRIG